MIPDANVIYVAFTIDKQAVVYLAKGNLTILRASFEKAVKRRWRKHRNSELIAVKKAELRLTVSSGNQRR